MPDVELIKGLIPINTLREENLAQLLQHSEIERIGAGETVFRIGDDDADAVYLLEGELILAPRSGFRRTIAAGSEDARYALSNLKPRQFTGIAKTGCTVFRVDASVLDRLLTQDETGAYQTAEIGGQDGDWVFRMIQHPALDKVPAGNLMALFERLDPVDVKQGAVVIRQGDGGDYYYIIKTGKVSVSRKTVDGKVQMLAEFGPGDSFGEEALVTSAPRNANVIALSDCVLMRLAKADFDELLREPLIRQVTLPEAQEMARKGAGLIDVRTLDEFQRGAIVGAINLPLNDLRRKATNLDARRKYIVYCESGARSAAGAFLLSQRKLDVCVLRGGLSATVVAQS
jgi:CRP-like cAMP-binding protein